MNYQAIALDEVNDAAAKALEGHEVGTGCILYRDGSGMIKDWFVAADPSKDGEDTMRSILKNSLPSAEFIGWAIK